MEIRHIQLSADRLKELSGYLREQWQRAVDARTNQVDAKYRNWSKIYNADPKEARRMFPWPGASNLVVPLAQIHVDTFVAKTTGLILGTFPFASLLGYPADLKDSFETYLNYKAIFNWKFGVLVPEIARAGRITGTAVTKTVYVEEKETVVSASADNGITETEVTTYKGPRTRLIPFEDYYVYPITALRQEDVEIDFHKVRYTAETAKRKSAEGTDEWHYPWKSGPWADPSGEVKQTQGLESAIDYPQDVKRDDAHARAGVVDYMLKELQTVECHIKSYEILPGTYRRIIAVYCPKLNVVLDVYHYPTPRNVSMFNVYRPHPSSDLFYGDSSCRRLSTMQEEASTIHNQRRDNSTISNAPLFKQKSGSGALNSATQFYPGKTIIVDAMDDFDSMAFGQTLTSMIDQEQQTMSLAELVMGAGPLSQGNAEGFMGKRGVYSSQGTMAVISESNDRAGADVKILRDTASGIMKTSTVMQVVYDPDDECIAYFPPAEQENIRKAIKYAADTETRLHMMPFDVLASTAKMNQEVERQSLLQLSGVLSKHYQDVQAITQQLLNPGNTNPTLRGILAEILQGQVSMAKRLLRAWDDKDPNGEIIDVRKLFESTGTAWPGATPAGTPAGPQGAPGAPIARPDLQQLVSSGSAALQGAGFPVNGGAPPQ